LVGHLVLERRRADLRPVAVRSGLFAYQPRLLVLARAAAPLLVRELLWLGGFVLRHRVSCWRPPFWGLSRLRPRNSG